MDIGESGALSFKAIIDNTDLDKMTKVVEDKIIGMTKNIETNTKQFSDVLNKLGITYQETFESTTLKEFRDGIDQQRSAISLLEKDYKAVVEAQNKLASNPVDWSNSGIQAATQTYKDAKKAVNEVGYELETEKKLLKEREELYSKVEGELTKLNSKQTSYVTQLQKIREEMMRLQEAGNSESTRYRELQTELEKTGTAYKKVQQEQKNLTTAGSATISGLLQGMSLVSGVFSAGSGVMSLFVKDNERLAAIQTKLQAAMAITIGLQQVSTALHSTSSFRMNVVTKATQLWNKAIQTLNVQMGLSNTLSKGLAGIGIGLLIAAIAALVYKYKEWAKEQQGQQKTLREANANIQEQVSKVRILESVLKDSTRSYSERENALKQLKTIMPEYNAMLGKEGKLIEDNTGALKRYIKELLNVEMAKSVIKQLAEAETAMREFKDGLTELDKANLESPADGQWVNYNGKKYKTNGDNERAQRVRFQNDELQAEIDKYTKLAEKYVVADTLVPKDRTKAFYEQKQKNAKALLDTMSDLDKGSDAWKAAVKDYNDATQSLKIWDINAQNRSISKKNKEDENFNQKKIEADQWLLNKQKELSNEQIKVELESEQKLLDLEKDSYDKRIKQNELNYRKELQSIKDFEANKEKAQQEAAKKIYTSENGGNDKGFDFSKFDMSKLPKGLRLEDIKEQVTKLATEAQAAWENADMLAYEEMTKGFMSFQQQKADVTKTYQDLITQYESMGLSDRVALIKKERDQTLGELSAMEIQTSDLWKDLFQNMDNLSEKTIKDIIAKLRELVEKIEDPDIKNALIKQLEEGTKNIETKNPFTKLTNGIKEYKNASDDASKNKAMIKIGESAKDMSAIVTESLGSVVNGLKDLGMMDEDTEKILGDVMNLVSSLGDAGEGIARLSAGDITAAPQAIAGVVGTITSVFSLFDSKSRDIERKIKAHKQQLIELGRIYKDIEYQVNNAVGEDYYSEQLNAIENLKQQQKELDELIYQEGQKKKKNRDDGAIESWKDQKNQLKHDIEDIQREIAETLVQTSFKDMSNQLADALVSAFEAGESAAKDFDKTFNKVIANAVKNSLKMRILEPEINTFTDALSKYMLNNNYSAVGFDFEKWRELLKNAGEAFTSGLEEFEKYFDVVTDDITNDPLTGAVKSVTEETASALAGQITMMRINQSMVAEFIKNQLYTTILKIANNSEYNKHLESIDNTLLRMGNDKISNNIRAKGL